MKYLSTGRSRLRTLALILGLILAPVVGRTADVYHSPGDDGTAGGPASVVIGAPATSLFLYIFGGPRASAPSEECSGLGAGDEVCGWDVLVVASGGVRIVSFVPEGDVVSSIVNGKVFRANGVNAVDPPSVPDGIGVLTVSATGPGELNVSGNQSVTSRLTADPIPSLQLALAHDGTGDFDADGDIDGSDAARLASNPGLVDLAVFAPNFGRTK